MPDSYKHSGTPDRRPTEDSTKALPAREAPSISISRVRPETSVAPAPSRYSGPRPGVGGASAGSSGRAPWGRG